MTFQPGTSGNPKGRPLGSFKRETQLVLPELDKQKDVDPLDLMAAIVSNPAADISLRLQAAGMLAPYLHVRGPRLGKKVKLSRPTTVAQAKANIAHLCTLAAKDEISIEAANGLADLQHRYIEAHLGGDAEGYIAMLEAALLKANANLGIAIQGGMPTMPGTEGVIMPAKLLPSRSRPGELPPADGNGDDSGQR
jgi:hypothetical protein